MKLIVFGATGFIGRHLIQKVGLEKCVPVSRCKPENSHWEQADLLQIDSIKKVLKKGSTVINLAYSTQFSPEENSKMAHHLIQACVESNISTVIHCSTALVAGNSKESIINENTPCYPTTHYEKNKYEIEKIFLEAANANLNVFILRPTGVIGLGGQNLKKMLSEIRYGNPIINFVRSALYGSRPLNLVPVQDVVNALLHFNEKPSLSSGVYICASDEDTDNQFDSIETIMRNLLKKQTRKSIPFPGFFINALLNATRSGSSRFVNRKYSSDKLISTGFQRSITISEAVKAFVLSEIV